MGLWIKTRGQASEVAASAPAFANIAANAMSTTNIVVDFWCGTGKQTHGDGLLSPGHQMANMSGTRQMQPNLRNIPFVLDPFAITRIDAVLVTHSHKDHMSKEIAAHVVKSHLMTENEYGKRIPVPFIGPKDAVETWISWGVPQEQCSIVKPGDRIKVKDIEIAVYDSFDRTMLLTTPHESCGSTDDGIGCAIGTSSEVASGSTNSGIDGGIGDHQNLWGMCPNNMDDLAVNYLFVTPSARIYHAGDSHYSIYFAQHGRDILKRYGRIHLAFGAFALNPVGIQDKMESTDILRMAEALKTEVVIPLHYDAWSNMQANPEEIQMLWDMRQERLGYEFHPFTWEVGGRYVYPDDKIKRYYHHDRGFHDVFTHEQNVPFRSFL